MVLYILKWNIHPNKAESYLEWAEKTIPRLLSISGMTELRGYRGAIGAPQIITTVEFADMAAWADWHSHADVQNILTELRTVATDITTELWGPSPLTPEPVRPGG